MQGETLTFTQLLLALVGTAGLALGFYLVIWILTRIGDEFYTDVCGFKKTFPYLKCREEGILVKKPERWLIVSETYHPYQGTAGPGFAFQACYTDKYEGIEIRKCPVHGDFQVKRYYKTDRY